MKGHTTMASKENRTEPRFDEKTIIKVVVADTGDDSKWANKTFFTLTTDISAGGLAISTHTAPDIGTILKIKVAFSDPPQSVENLIGRVTWVQKIPQGAQFIVGIDLSQSAEPNLIAWQNIITERLAEK